MGPTWGPSGADRTQVGPMLTLWTLLSGFLLSGPLFTNLSEIKSNVHYTLFRARELVWNVINKMADILFRPQSVNASRGPRSVLFTQTKMMVWCWTCVQLIAISIYVKDAIDYLYWRQTILGPNVCFSCNLNWKMRTAGGSRCATNMFVSNLWLDACWWEHICSGTRAESIQGFVYMGYVVCSSLDNMAANYRR